MAAPPSLSLCMLVKNEAQALPRCLASLAAGDPDGLITERIVLDTGSTDDTIALARRLQCQVFSYVWNDDFAAARNHSLAQASGDWILVLDADEQLLPNALLLLAPLLQQPDLVAINLLRQEIGARQSPYSLVSRLFRRHPKLQFRRPYHAMIDDSLGELLQREPQWKVVDTTHPSLRHDGYQAGAIAAQNKFHRARTAMERYLAQRPDDGYCCAKLGALYGEQGDWARGIALLERGLASLDLDGPDLDGP
ncbi:MAG: glycosyltransferase, partial [Synechococcales cyanobacterium RM1_1_8]|nr:glycosyltransferase [Synechococcales cyanobacterium RM1_1_8]